MTKSVPKAKKSIVKTLDRLERLDTVLVEKEEIYNEKLVETEHKERKKRIVNFRNELAKSHN